MFDARQGDKSATQQRCSSDSRKSWSVPISITVGVGRNMIDQEVIKTVNVWPYHIQGTIVLWQDCKRSHSLLPLHEAINQFAQAFQSAMFLVVMLQFPSRRILSLRISHRRLSSDAPNVIEFSGYKLRAISFVVWVNSVFGANRSTFENLVIVWRETMRPRW
jgi:hypothetical protein